MENIRALNDHIANIGEELTKAAELIRHEVEAMNMREYTMTMWHRGIDVISDSQSGKRPQFTGYTISRGSGNNSGGHANQIVVYGDPNLRDFILRTLNGTDLTFTTYTYEDIAKLEDEEPIGLHSVYKLCRLYHDRLNADAMNDRSPPSAMSTEESRLRVLLAEHFTPVKYTLPPEWTEAGNDAPVDKRPQQSPQYWKGETLNRDYASPAYRIDTAGHVGIAFFYDEALRDRCLELLNIPDVRIEAEETRPKPNPVVAASSPPKHLTKFVFRATWGNGAVGTLVEYGRDHNAAAEILYTDNPGLKSLDCIGFATT